MARNGTIRGGDKLRRFIEQNRHQQGVKQIEVGFFKSARYPPVHTGLRGGGSRKPQPVTNVAAWNEFGTEGPHPIPERPFFRQAIKGAKKVLLPILKDNLNPLHLYVDRRTAGLLGTAMKGLIQKSITRLRTPPNAPRTIEAKGSSNPLLDTGFLRQSTTYRIDGDEA